MKKRTKIIIITLAIITVCIAVAVIYQPLKGMVWKQQWDSISPPEHTVVLDSGFFTNSGSPMGGNDDSLMYVYYWLMESKLSEEDIFSYYSSQMEKTDSSFHGWEPYLNVVRGEDILKVRGKFRNKLEEYIRLNSSENISLVLLMKEGRSYFYN